MIAGGTHSLVFTPPPETHEPSGKRRGRPPQRESQAEDPAQGRPAPVSRPRRPILSPEPASPLDSLIDAEVAVTLARVSLRKVGNQKHERHGNLQVALSAVRNAEKYIQALLESEEGS